MKVTSSSTPPVGHRDNLNGGFGDPVNYPVGKTRRIVRGSGAAPRTRERSLLYPDLAHRCIAQHPYSTPIQHPHPLSHPSFRADDRQALRTPRREDAAPLSKLSDAWVSCLQVKRWSGFRQSTHKADGFTRRAANKGRASDQSQDGKTDRINHPAARLGTGRQGDQGASARSRRKVANERVVRGKT